MNISPEFKKELEAAIGPGVDEAANIADEARRRYEEAVTEQREAYDRSRKDYFDPRDEQQAKNEERAARQLVRNQEKLVREKEKERCDVVYEATIRLLDVIKDKAAPEGGFDYFPGYDEGEIRTSTKQKIRVLPAIGTDRGVEVFCVWGTRYKDPSYKPGYHPMSDRGMINRTSEYLSDYDTFKPRMDDLVRFAAGIVEKALEQGQLANPDDLQEPSASSKIETCIEVDKSLSKISDELKKGVKLQDALNNPALLALARSNTALMAIVETDPDLKRMFGIPEFKGLCIRGASLSREEEAVAVMSRNGSQTFITEQKLLKAIDSSSADSQSLKAYRGALESLQEAVAKKKDLGAPLGDASKFVATHEAKRAKRVLDKVNPVVRKRRGKQMAPK